MDIEEKIVAYFGISFVSSFVFAVSWVIVMNLTLPETDEAHGQVLFLNPIVLIIMSFVAGISALVSWPFYTILGWRNPPLKVAIASGVITLTFIIATTPFHALTGWLGSYFVLLISLIICRLMLQEDD
jgi:hypothetical protein